MKTDRGTVIVGDPLRLVDKYPNNRLVIGTGNLGVHQLETVIHCHPLSDGLHSLFNGIQTHRSSPKSSHTKEKVGANPPDDTAALRASRELYEKGKREATRHRSPV